MTVDTTLTCCAPHPTFTCAFREPLGDGIFAVRADTHTRPGTADTPHTTVLWRTYCCGHGVSPLLVTEGAARYISAANVSESSGCTDWQRATRWVQITHHGVRGALREGLVLGFPNSVWYWFHLSRYLNAPPRCTAKMLGKVLL